MTVLGYEIRRTYTTASRVPMSYLGNARLRAIRERWLHPLLWTGVLTRGTVPGEHSLPREILPSVTELYALSHEQETTYWCGPATVQVVHDWWGTPVSQQTYATQMGTTQHGTDFTVVDDELRFRTGKSYYWRAVATATDFYSRIQYSISTPY